MRFRRLLNRDRSYNVKLIGAIRSNDLYHSILSLSWPRFFLGLLFCFLFLNVAFGVAFYFSGPGALEGVSTIYGWPRFLECFFFSVQTMATIGYGRISPVSLVAHCLVTVEAIIALLGLAAGTGLFFTRFSRPTARVQFSKVALVTNYEGKRVLTFRMANQRENRIVEARVSIVLAQNEISREGIKYRRMHDLAVLRSVTPMFYLSWTIFHPLDERSPLYKADLEAMIASEAEVLVSLTGIDETFAQPIYDRFSYGTDDIVWDAQFKDVITQDKSGKFHVDLKEFDSYVSTAKDSVAIPSPRDRKPSNP